jgi:hypothetical protein
MEKIVNIFYPKEPLHPAPVISGIYYYFNALVKLFRCNLVSKARDDASVRGYHENLLFYCQPSRLRKIHDCDFIFQEIKRTSMKHMTPNYCQYIQRLIKIRAPSSVVRGQIVEMETYTMPLRGTYEDVLGRSLLGLRVAPRLLMTLTVLWALDLALVTIIGPLARRVLPLSSRTCGTLLQHI